MIIGILLGVTAAFVLLSGLTTHFSMAQNATNAMNDASNTASEMGQNASNAMGNSSPTANQTMSECDYRCDD